FLFFFSSRRRHTRFSRDWSSDVCSSDLNIFGGIVRCDRVANGVVEAYKKIGDIRVPIIVRLQGTNAEEGARIIEESGLKVFSAILLKDAAQKVKEVLA